GAPEAFLFLQRRWERLREPASRKPTFGSERIAIIRDEIRNDWAKTIATVEWNPTAAIKVIEFIFPATESWLISAESTSSYSVTSPQGLSVEKYWLRAINEAISPGDFRDQEVIRSIRDW